MWRILEFIEGDGLYQMSVDEALLRSVASDSSPPTLRFYTFKPPAITIGYHQKLDDETLNRAKKFNLQVVRRPTGGRAVYHDNNLTYSIVAKVSDPIVGGTIFDTYKKISLAFVRGFKKLGLNFELQRIRSSSSNRSPLCFSLPSRYEILCGGKKVIGSAQVRRAGAFLQQGTILTDEPNIPHSEIFETEDEFISISSVLKRKIEIEELIKFLKNGFESQFGIKFKEENLSTG